MNHAGMRIEDMDVTDVEDEADYVPPLEGAGHMLRVREPGHRVLRTPALDVHVHVCSVGSSWEERHLLFLDWLRHDDGDRRAYADLKRRLARRDWTDMNAHAEAKARARAWAANAGWALGG